MRLATCEHEGKLALGLVLRHPRDGSDWVFRPRAVAAAAATLPSVKGAGHTWWRPNFPPAAQWPDDTIAFLRQGAAGMDAARRVEEFVLRLLDQGDPFVLADAGAPLATTTLAAPIPDPPLLLGVVGNNPGFLRMDPARARNLQQPKCHQRTCTSVVGPGEPIVLPAGGEQWAGTTELGVVIGLGGRDIPRERAREHIAGYTVINDGLGCLYARRWAELDRKAGHSGFHFHSSNTASWLDKQSDTMLAMGPWLITPEEVGDPYDLLCLYREGGVQRNRGHTGALCTGIEETIHWLSRFLTLEPGMVLHFGATTQDGLPSVPPARFHRGHLVECEIERIGVLGNPLVAPAVQDWRGEDAPGRHVHPSPLVRRLIAAGHIRIADPAAWSVRETRHFWTAMGNARASESLEGIAARTYPLFYNAPAASLSASGGTVELRADARALTVHCELAVVVGSLAKGCSAAEAAEKILGLAVMVVLRDSSFREDLIQPHVLQAPMGAIYARWPAGFNIVGPPVAAVDFRGRRMRVSIEGAEEAVASTDDYAIDPARLVSELSQGVTLLPGDVIALGIAGPGLTLPADRKLPAGIRIRAEIDGFGESHALLDDRRRSAVASLS